VVRIKHLTADKTLLENRYWKNNKKAVIISKNKKQLINNKNTGL